MAQELTDTSAARSAMGPGSPTAEPKRRSSKRPPPARGAAHKPMGVLLKYGAPLLSVVSGLLLWEMVARIWFDGRTALFAGPIAIWGEASELWRAGELQHHILVSGYELLVGVGLATCVGIVVGFLMAASRLIHQALDPWVHALYATPRIAIAPLLIIWLGIGQVSIISVVFLSAVFPILINTLTGLRVVDRKLIDVGRTFGATRFEMFRTIQFPASLPFILTGIRLAYGRGLVGVVVGELIGATAGIGWLIYRSGQVLNTTRLLVGVVVLMLAGVVGNAVIKQAEARFTGWAHPEEAK